MAKLAIATVVSLAIVITELSSGSFAGPAVQKTASDRVFVCYFGSWAKYRPGAGKFDVENIDPHLCTHLIYGFAGLVQNKIAALDPYNDLVEEWGRGAFQRFNNLRRENPKLKTLIAIGGWNEGSQKYSVMSSNPATRAIFVQSVLEFLDKHKFDGLDMDWEYPAFREGAPEDRENFVTLLRELRQALQPRGYLLTAAVSAGKGTIDGAYDVPRVAELLDLINIMSYDMHGAWHQYVHHNAPMGVHPLDLSLEIAQEEENQYFNVKFGVEYWLKLGAPKEKLVMGIPLYGRIFTLDRPQDGHELYSPARQPGIAGPYTREGGFLGFNEICELQRTQGSSFQRYWSKEIHAPYAVFQTNQWLGYDDVESIQYKVDYLNQLGLRGAMVWSVETDDFTGHCNQGPFTDKKNPLLKTIAAGVFGGVPTADPSIIVPPPYTGRPTPAPDDRCLQNGWNAPACSATYYWCQANGLEWQVTAMTCHPGTVFDVSVVTCKDPVQLGCGVDGTTQKPSSTSPTTTSAASSSSTTTTTTTTTTTAKPASSTTSPTGVTNPPSGDLCSYCKEPGDHQHPFTCTKFLKCWGSPEKWYCHEENCSAGLGFNGQIRACVWLSDLPSCQG